MARAVQKTAAKDYPDHGIKKGDKYWFAAVKTGPRSSMTIRSLNPIPRSRLTGSEFLSRLYEIEDGFDNIAHEDGMVEVLQNVAQELRDLGSEQQEKFDNMPEGLQQGDTGQMLEERASNCDAWADEIEQHADALEEAIKETGEKSAEDFGDSDDETAMTEDEVEEAREAERDDAYQNAIDNCTESNPF